MTPAPLWHEEAELAPGSPQRSELLHVQIGGERDVFAVRQRGREVAAAVGLDALDQVRVATALSEVGREVLGSGGAAVVFAVEAGPPPALVVTLATSASVPPPREPGQADGLLAARRLVDEVRLEPLPVGNRLHLTKWLPAHLRAPSAGEIQQVRRRLAGSLPISAMDELRTQNRETLATLEEVQHKQEELIRLNSELEETNRGVLAMYSQLSDELEETNRGVVALYAELDEKSAALKSANEAKSRFLANVSHELRTPVNSILGLARLLGDDPSAPLPDEQAKQVAFIRTNATDLLSLVNELLDLAKAESGRLEPVLSQVSLADVFAQLRGSLRPLAARGGVELQVDEVADLPPLHTDEKMLLHILRNLLTNGMKFTERGEVRLSATALESAQHVEIVVQDTGVGIAPSDQERVFEEFFQVAGPLQARTRGTGLGLPYSRRLTELLGGTLQLTSQVGKGSRFVLELPLTWSAPLAATHSQPPAESAEVSIGIALVVDDDASFRHVLRGMLQGVAERVLEAEDGEDAWAQLQNCIPDVILLDLRMPALDGPGLLAALASEPRLRDVPVIVITSVDLAVPASAELPGTAAVVPKTGLTKDAVLSAIRTASSPGPGT
jgi:signal transduction histidine kinase/CheY-like chemotaxis protein